MIYNKIKQRKQGVAHERLSIGYLIILLLLFLSVNTVEAQEVSDITQNGTITEVRNTGESGFTIINGQEYFFDKNGNKVLGYFSYDNEYYYMRDGYRLKNAWATVTGGYRTYFGSDGKAVKGLQTIDGKEYYFNDNARMRLGYIECDGEYYYMKEGYRVRNAWATVDKGKRVYFELDGTAVKGERVIDGIGYLFDQNGQLSSTLSGLKIINDKEYYFNDNGQQVFGHVYEGQDHYYMKDGYRLKNAWATMNLGQVYFGSDGKAVKGFQNINNKEYYFNQSGYKIQGYFSYNNEYYYMKEGYKVKNAWATVTGGFRTYFGSDGKAVKGLKAIDEKEYYFNDNARKRLGYIKCDGEYYYMKEGYRVRNAWATVDKGKRVYFDADGKAAKGEKAIEGVGYLFDGNGQLSETLSGMKNLNSKEYYFDKNGKQVLGHVYLSNGHYYMKPEGILRNAWATMNFEKKVYFGADGKTVKGFQVIENKEYFFDKNENKVLGYFSHGNDYYYMKDGYKVKNAWATVSGGYRIYFGAEGKAVKGLQTIDKKEYYFNDNGRQRLGYIKCDGDYYYMKEGYRVKNAWVTVDKGKRVYFEADGRAAKGEKIIDGIGYSFDKNGQLQSSDWRKGDNNLYFYDSDGKMAKDWNHIEGKKYFFNDKGQMIGRAGVKKIIDISEHNGKIDWNTVKSQGDVDGVILRIGYGYNTDNPYDQIDDRFIYNYTECKRLDIPVGIYFYSYGRSTLDAKYEAQRVVNLLSKLGIKPGNLDLPVYYDLEEYRDSSLPLTAMAKIFCQLIEDAGYDAGIYASTSYYNNYLDYNSIKKYSLWVAQYNYNCTYMYPFDGWQYTSSGSIPGISGRVDMNVWL